MRKIVIFCLKCLIISLLLTIVLPRFDLICRYILAVVLHGRWPTAEAATALPHVSAVKLLPFFTFILAVSGVSFRRRLVSSALAIAIYLFLDLAMTLVWHDMPNQRPNPELLHVISTQMWEMLGRWLLPFVLAALAIYGVWGGRMSDRFLSRKSG